MAKNNMKYCKYFIMIGFIFSITLLNAVNSIITIEYGASICFSSNGENKSYLINNGADDGELFVNSGASFSCWAPEALIDFTVTGEGDISLPVELSSFTAIQTSTNFAQINWTTQSESELLGYNIYRNETEMLTNSILLNSMLISPTNSSYSHDYTFIDEDVEYDQIYYYWLESLEIDNGSELFGPVSLILVNPENEIIEPPLITVLKSSYPNPFNPSTTIEFDIMKNEIGILSIFNIKGQIIVSKKFTTGTHRVVWNAEKYGSGVYFYKLETADYLKINKMIMLK